MLRKLLLSLLFLAALPLSAAGGGKARPLAGIGLLAIRADMVLPEGAVPRLSLYREPKLGRLAELAVDRLPGLAPAMMPAPGEWHAIVTASRPGWLQIIYDDAEREGWVAGRKLLRFQRWGEFLQGRQIALLPGMRKDYYSLREEASLSSGQGASVGKAGLLTVEKVVDDWLYVHNREGVLGWLRWRDDNGRLLILLNPQITP